MRLIAALFAFLAGLAVVPAAAAYKLCNNTAYVLDAALAIEIEGATATKGWFRVLPGHCRALLAGDTEGDRFFLHAATPHVYGERSETPDVARMLCVNEGEFLLSGAESCAGRPGRLAPFTEVTQDVASKAGTTRLQGPREMEAKTARNAGLILLLGQAGYDTTAPEGLDSVLAAFRKDANIAPDAGDEVLFSALLDAAAATGRTR